MKNTLVIYRLLDNRVVHFAEQSYGMPVIGDYDSTALWDSSSMDYQVGVNVYADGDFDPETDELTDAACTAYGIETGEKSHYIKDLEIDTPVIEDENKYVDDFVATIADDLITGFTEDVLSVENRTAYLQLTINPVVGITERDPETVTGYQVFSPVDPDDAGILANAKLEILVKKIYYDGSEASSDTDQVVLRVSGGWIANPYIVPLSAGNASFDWQPPPGQATLTVVVEPIGNVYEPGRECLPGSKTIVMGCTIF